MRWRRRSDDDVTHALRESVAGVTGVVGGAPAFNRLPNASAAVSGTIEVVDSTTYKRVLIALVDVLDRELGASAADRVTVYLSARAGDRVLDPSALGLNQKPSVAELRRQR
jgi:hypothetical protein